MPMAMIRAYLERIPGLVAETKMHFADLFALPHMKEDQAQRAFDRWAEEMGAPKPKPVVADDAILAMLGILVVEAA
jgi:hypothetical protein